MIAARTTCFVLATTLACTDTDIYDPRPERELVNERAVRIEGTFCTPPVADARRPLKVLLIIDSSPSLAVTDPDGSRATATVALLESLPREPEVEVAVMVFSGGGTSFLTRSGQTAFEPLVGFDDVDLSLLKTKVLAGVAGAAGPTDFVKPLEQAYQVIVDDITRQELLGTSRARYEVVFLSGGRPTVNQDQQLLCEDGALGDNVVLRFPALRDRTDAVTLHTVHVFRPAQLDVSSCANAPLPSPPDSCRLNTPAGPCPLVAVAENAERLRRMAVLGAGSFRDFQYAAPVTFIGLVHSKVRRSWVFDSVVASNLSAPSGSPPNEADSDSDGLLDSDERRAGTDVFSVDTDLDGFSDGLEVYSRARGAAFNPLQLNAGCPDTQRTSDSDCDGLLDCDEQFLGTNERRADTDGDGVIDIVEVRAGTLPTSADLDLDPDRDGILNRDELQQHTAPLLADATRFSALAYRTQVAAIGLDEQARTCWRVTVSNVSLANTATAPTGLGSPDQQLGGLNDVLVSLTLRGDDPSSRPLTRLQRFTGPRFIAGGPPVPEVLQVRDEDLSAACPPKR